MEQAIHKDNSILDCKAFTPFSKMVSFSPQAGCSESLFVAVIGPTSHFYLGQYLTTEFQTILLCVACVSYVYW